VHAGEQAGARVQLAARIKELMAERGISYAKLARATTYTERYLKLVVRGTEVPSPTVINKIDDALGAGKELVALRARALREQQAERHGLRLPSDREVAGTGGELVEWQARVEAREKTGEVSPPDRRQALQAGGLAAAELSRRIARANPDPLDLDDYEVDIHRVATIYRTTPHEHLAAAIVPTWREVENILDDRISPRVRGQLTLIAGQYAFYLGYLGFDLGDDDAARRFLRLASQHATEAAELLPARSSLHSDVTLLAASVVAVRSSVAYFTGRYAAAADLAAEAQDGAHPYVAPILAACEARAAARAGRPDDARRALQDMQDTVWRGTVMPGPVMLDEETAQAFLAVVNALLGAGEIAEPHARRSLELLDSDPDHYVQIGGTYNALCRAYLRRRDPDPEQAADAAGKALAIVKGRPNRSVVQQAGQMYRQMQVRWPELPAVRDLGELVASSRKALPAARSV
jgi:transcriptional regulator with XRE-family HTH domain